MTGIQIVGPEILFKIKITENFVIPITQTALSSFIVSLMLCIAFVLLGRNLKKRPGRTQVLVEKGVTMLYNLVGDTMGRHNLKFAPYIGALFLSSVFGSLISTFGFFRSSTADLSTTMTWAVMTTLIVWYSNIKEMGFFKWLKSFSEPIAVITPINIISELANPVSMAFRHFGNILGGSVLTTLIYYALGAASSFAFSWIPSKLISTIPFLQIGIPAILSLYFDFFSAVIQALVFCMLTMIYIGMANPSEEERVAAREEERLANEQKQEKKRLKKEKKALKKASSKNV